MRQHEACKTRNQSRRSRHETRLYSTHRRIMPIRWVSGWRESQGLYRWTKLGPSRECVLRTTAPDPHYLRKVRDREAAERTDRSVRVAASLSMTCLKQIGSKDLSLAGSRGRAPGLPSAIGDDRTRNKLGLQSYYPPKTVDGVAELVKSLPGTALKWQ
jgi:hypothetical protein